MRPKKEQNRRLAMRHIKRILQLHVESGLSVRQIAAALSIPRSTVSDYIRRFEASSLDLGAINNNPDRFIYRALFPEQRKPGPRQKSRPDFARLHQELKKKHVTRLLLWEEYRECYPLGYGYSRFCQLYDQWRKTLDLSMRQVHKAGEKLFVDYSGLTMEIIDPKTGAVSAAEIFVATLGASGYTYAEATPSQRKESFIASHRRAFEFFKGVPAVCVPDNLKSAVTRCDFYDPEINESYKDMADHYGTVIIPARPRKPKDKAKVELSIKLVQRWILAKLRHRQFFALDELNRAIWDLLDEFNRRPIRKFNKSRYDLYRELDQPALKSLPSEPYVYRTFKECKVNVDYHIQLEGAYYSVPYQLIGKIVTARYSETTVEVYFQHKRVAIHRRLYKAGAYSTRPEHMASSHKAYAAWTPSRLIQWGKSFGKHTGSLIAEILEKRPHPEMGFRTCLGILRAAKDHKAETVEAVSLRMLELQAFKVRHFRSILTNKTYLQPKQATIFTPDDHHENVRGELYYE